MGKTNSILTFVFLFFMLTGCGGGDSGGTTASSASVSSVTSSNSSSESFSSVSSSEAASSASSSAQAADIFDLWQELSDTIAETPDDLVAEARRLVDAADPETIFYFVRDRVQSIPPYSSYYNSDASLWPVEVTLYAGMGTPRDKAELLNTLLQRAGFDSELRKGDLTEPIDDLSKVFFPVPRDTSTLDLDALVQRWPDAAGAPAEQNISIMSVTQEARAYALAFLDSGTVIPPEEAYALDRPLEKNFPEVHATINGRSVAMNPTFHDAQYGQTYLTSSLPTADIRYHDVTIRLWARKTGTGNDPEAVTLLEHTYDYGDIIGNKLVISTPAPLSLQELLPATLDELNHFIPRFAVEPLFADAIDPDLEVLGDQFDLQGHTFAVNENGDIVQDGDIVVPQTQSDRSVKSIAIDRIISEAYPEILLYATVVDAEGHAVLALKQSDFDLQEDNVSVSKQLSWRTQAQKIIIVADTSTSMPVDFRDEGLGTFIAQITDGLTELQDVMLEDVIEDPYGINYSKLMEAVNQSPTMIVLVSDGIFVDELSEKWKTDITTSGIPVIALFTESDYKEGGREAMNELALISKGQLYEVSDRDTAVDIVVNAIPSFPSRYELRYTSSSTGTDAREVRLMASEAAAVGMYVPPTEPAPVRQFAGLYLTVDNGYTEKTHDIAGLPLTSSINEATLSHAQTVHAALFGKVELAVVPPLPPVRHVLQTWLREKLSQKPLWEAMQGQTDVFEAWENGFRVPNPVLLGAFADLNDENDTLLTYPLGASYILHKSRPSFNEGMLEQIDLLPINHFTTAAADPQQAWRTTFVRSFAWGLTESALANTSTYSLLKDKKLVAMTMREIYESDFYSDKWRRLTARYARVIGYTFSDYTFLVPEDGEPAAAWAVHNDTGMVFGALEDGSGGGQTLSDEEKIALLIRAYEQFDRLYSLVGLDTGFWFKLEIAKAKQVLYATNEIKYLDDPANNPNTIDPEIEALKFACDTALGALMGLIPGGAAISQYDAGWQLISEGAITLSPCQYIQ